MIKKIFQFLLVVFFSFSLFNCAPPPRPRSAPPPLRKEVRPPKPGPKYVWISGHHVWRHGHWHWIRGHWAKRKHGKTWVPGHWVKRGRHWVWVKGHWR
jgi:hypothetical protein